MARRSTSRKPGLLAVDLEQQLPKGPLAPAYLLCGSEELLLREAARQIAERALGPEPGPALTELDGTRAGLAEVLDELRTLPFFGGGHRVVVVAQAGPDGKKAGFIGEHAEALLAFLAHPPASATLVLSARKVDQRYKGTKQLLGRLVQVDCSPPDERGLLRFLRARAGRHGRPFAPRADQVLLERLGGQHVALDQIDAEVQKLAAAGQGPITAAEVEALASVGSSEESFDLIDSVGRGDLGGALGKLSAIFRDGLVQNGDRQRDPTGIAFLLLGMLRWDLGRLLRGRALLERGTRAHEIARELRVFRDKDHFAARLRRADRERLGQRHAVLRQADLALKTSATSPQAALTDVVVRLALSDAGS